MSGNGIDLGIVAFYALGALAYGLWVSRRVRTSLDYTVAGRQLGLFALVGTLVMTELNPSTMIWFGSISYTAGPRAAWLCLIFIVGLGSYGLLVARRWQRLQAVSIAEMFEARYSLGLRRAVSLCYDPDPDSLLLGLSHRHQQDLFLGAGASTVGRPGSGLDHGRPNPGLDRAG